MSITADVQGLSPSAKVIMFVLDVTPLGGPIERFHPGKNDNYADIVWQGVTYTGFPCELSGLGWNGQGQVPKPSFRVSNNSGIVSALNLQYEDLVGMKLTRKMTLAKYLDAVNFPGGVNPTADPNAYFPDEVYYINRKVAETKLGVEYELGALFDVEGVKLPRRYIIQNVCPWVYRSAECSYTGGPVATITDAPTSDSSQDKCGKRLSSCKLRFGANNQLPFGGFPSVGLVQS